MAMLDSVTVSMGLLMKGVLMVSLRVRAEVRSYNTGTPGNLRAGYAPLTPYLNVTPAYNQDTMFKCGLAVAGSGHHWLIGDIIFNVDLQDTCL